MCACQQRVLSLHLQLQQCGNNPLYGATPGCTLPIPPLPPNLPRLSPQLCLEHALFVMRTHVAEKEL